MYTVLDNEFSDDFGITEEEMDKIIKDFKIQDKKEDIKKWYDGYTIGNIKEKIERLLNDEPLEVYIDQETVILNIEQNENNIWGYW